MIWAAASSISSLVIASIPTDRSVVFLSIANDTSKVKKYDRLKPQKWDENQIHR
jgi:hypothetical protein